MWAKLVDGGIVIGADEAAGKAALAGLPERHMFLLTRTGESVVLHDCGEEAVVRQTPINVVSHAAPPIDLISNFAATPFSLDGAAYASVEGFWQCWRYGDAAERARVAMLAGRAAKAAGAATPPERFDYGGASLRWGSWEHWQLMRRACQAKFAQNEDARAALLGTLGRPLVHRTRRDSRSIPNVVMAQIWTEIREALAKEAGADAAAKP
ncbi:MAG: NADAR family protein [Reyranellaceae bacterium]